MKFKKLLAFLLAGTMMLSFSACGDKNNDNDGEDKNESIGHTDDNDNDVDNESNVYTINTANANAKTAYNVVKAFSEKCETAGKKLSADEDVTTSVLTIGTSDTTGKVSNITDAVAGTNSLAEGAEDELIKAVSYACGDDLSGSCFVIIFNSKGFPKSVYWASNEDDRTVGKYPAPEDDVLTSGGIKSITANGDSSFGDIEKPEDF